MVAGGREVRRLRSISVVPGTVLANRHGSAEIRHPGSQWRLFVCLRVTRPCNEALGPGRRG